MDIAALIVWIVTALGGFYLLGTWISKGGHRQPSSSRFPPPLIFGHFALAAIGLILWIIYVATDSDALEWIAFIIILVVALLGFTMLARWIPTYRSRSTSTDEVRPAEGHFPVAVVAAHGALAATTVVLVLLTLIGVGES
ncbi:MAG TPA: hypothetical protein VGK78_15105 [Nocardioides sp.]|uniref:hypothetical protein n=1 Tax=Nocardioides sp. TaxID=35761 RepID=UPI002F414C3D